MPGTQGGGGETMPGGKPPHAPYRQALIVEDDPVTIHLIERLMARNGWEVHTASSGEEALRRARSLPDALLLLDYSLPDMTAEDLMAGLGPVGSRRPFVVITGQGSEEVAVAMMKLGARDYLTKGARLLDQLPAVVERIYGEMKLDQLKRAHRASQAGTFVWDTRTGQFTCTAEFESVYGVQPGGLPADVEGFRDRIHPDDVEALERHLLVALAEGHCRPTEFRIVWPDGSVHWIAGWADVLCDTEGKAVQMVGLNMDVCDRKRTEVALAQANDELQIAAERLRTAHAELQATNEGLERRVAERTAQLRALAAELTHSEERECLRISTILHDDLQQFLFAARLRLDAPECPDSENPLQASLWAVDRLLEQCIRVTRDLSHELSPPVLAEDGLGAALEWLSHWMRENHRLEVRLRLDASADTLEPDVRALIFRSVRELLLNVVKHANVKRAYVRTRRAAGDMLEVVVSDSGAGFNPDGEQAGRDPRFGTGLFSIRGRLNMVGGRLEVTSTPGRGSRFLLYAPLARPPHDPAADG
ncbi:MAG: PAS domain-containing protein [Armatimonadetes bacterium]|nr:PAS domain-containing protein [Armatimonadota bacterium]